MTPKHPVKREQTGESRRRPSRSAATGTPPAFRDGGPSIGPALARELGPLFPIMRSGPHVECTHCHEPIRPGDTYFLKDDDDHGDRPVCYRCGILIEFACGRMTYATARAIPPIGGP